MTASYWPFIDIFRHYFAWDSEVDDRRSGESIISSLQAMVGSGALSGEQMEEIGPLLGNLLSVEFGGDWDERLRNASPEQIRHRTFMAIHDFLAALSKERLIVLVLEDLHWSDSLSIDLISLLMEALSLGPLFLLCVYRPEREHKCWRLASIAARKCPDDYTELGLRELSSGESKRMVESLLTIENLPSSVKDTILQQSQGNPLFVEEVVRSLIDSGMVYSEGEFWRAQEEIESVTVPESLQSVILSRVDHLEDNLKDILRRASVLGRLFRRRVLEHTTAQMGDLESVLWELEDHGLIYQERAIPEEEYSFKHVLTQEAVYGNIPKSRRGELHQQVGQALEEIYQESLDEYYEQLAYHYDRSDNLEKAVEYLLKAGEKTRRAYLNDEAIDYFKRALERLNESPVGESLKEQRLDALRGLGRIHQFIGRVPEAERFIRQAIALVKEMELPVRDLVRLYGLAWLGGVLSSQRNLDGMIRLGEEGLTLLGDEVSSSEEVALMNQLIAQGHNLKGNRKKCRELDYRTAEFIEQLPFTEELSTIYKDIFYCCKEDKNLKGAMRWLKALEGEARKHHDMKALAEVYRYAEFKTYRGDFHGAIPHLQRGLDLYSKIGDTMMGWCQHRMSGTFLALGDLQNFEKYMNEWIKGDHWRSNKKLKTTAEHWARGTICLVQGNWEEAIDAFPKVIELIPEIGFFKKWDIGNLPLGQAYLAQG